ncbi:MAG: hypothetical protein U0U70_00265 [Chitinophagaceae bacterium]
MNNPGNTNTTAKWLQVLFAAGLLIVFFLPWAAWKENNISGYDFPSGRFFRVSESKFNLANPFPQLNFSFYLFWLIPVLATVTALLAFQNKKTLWASLVTGALTLSLVTIFYLFSKTLIDLGVGENAFRMLKIPAYLAAVFSGALVLTALPGGKWPLKLAFLVAGPVFAFLGFMIVEKKVWGETHEETTKLKADYTIDAASLLHEFTTNDSAANAKYREKILVVNGTASSVQQMPDSTAVIQFSDTTGSYAAFAFEKDQYENVKNIKTGDQVSVKGSCSGSIFSDILGTTSVNFKRAVINKK